MPDKVKLPYFGDVDLAVIAAVGGGTVLVIGVIWFRAHQQKQQTQQAKQAQRQPEAVFVAGQLGEDPAGNKGPIDPQTGYVYGSEQDQERLGELAIEQYGAAIYYPPQLVPDVRKEHGKGGGGKGDREQDKDQEQEKDKDQEQEQDKDQRDAFHDIKVNPLNRPTTNDQWANLSVHDFQDEYDPTQLQETLQAVLQGRTVTSDQRDNFLRVTARMGNPPQGFPSPIHTSDTAAHPNASNPAFPNAYQQFYNTGMM